MSPKKQQRQSRRELILQHAEGLMRRTGFKAFSYQDLSDRVGISKPAIHHHFATKETLGISIIELYAAHFSALVERVESGARTAGEQLFVFLWLDDGPISGGEICPLGALQVHFETFPETMRRMTVELSVRFYEWLSAKLDEARAQGDIHDWGTAKQQAVFLMSSLQGARQQTRALGSEVFKDVCLSVESALFVDPASYRKKLHSSTRNNKGIKP